MNKTEKGWQSDSYDRRHTFTIFVKVEPLDLDHYVKEKSLDELLYTVGQEEKKIRTDLCSKDYGSPQKSVW